MKALTVKVALDNKEYIAELARCNTEMRKMSREQARQAKEMQRSFSNIKNAAIGMTAAFGVSVGAIESFRTVVSKNAEFEKSLSSLRALTGMTSEEVKRLGQSAIELGGTSMQTASQVAQAFTIIGSQSPELLKSRTALVAVTNDALILAEASGVAVEESAKALTMSMNQMQAASSDSRKYINVLAAASQQGSYDVAKLTQAIEKSGGVAGSIGIDFVQLVSAIEAVAPRVADASTAGNALKNIFLTLESSANTKLKPSVVGLTSALEELKNMNLSATQMADMFKKENVAVAIALVEAKDQYLGYTESLQGTNTAIEQQAINSDNLLGSINAMSSAWEAFILSMNASNGVLKTSADYLTTIIKGMQLTAGGNPYKSEVKNNIVSGQESMLQADVEANKKAGMKAGDAYKVAYEDRKKAIEHFIFKKNNEANELDDDLQNLKGLLSESSIFVEGKDYIDGLKSSIKIKEESFEKATNAVEHYEAALERVLGIGEEWDAKGYFSGDNINVGGRNKIEPVVIADESKKQSTKNIKMTADLFESDFGDDTVRHPLIVPVLDPIAQKEVDDWLEKDRPVKMREMFVDPVVKLPKKDDMAAAIEGFNAIANTLQTISGAADGSAASVMAWAASSMQAIGQVISITASLIAVKEAESNANAKAALTGVAASVSATPILGPVLAIGAVASLAAVLMSLPKFETGGIVPGVSFSGDNILARVNSGEMILNAGQQANLFNMIDRGASTSMGGGSVEFKVRGGDLVGVLSNYNKRTKL